jgi:hypothetical protein
MFYRATSAFVISIISQKAEKNNTYEAIGASFLFIVFFEALDENLLFCYDIGEDIQTDRHLSEGGKDGTAVVRDRAWYRNGSFYAVRA